MKRISTFIFAFSTLFAFSAASASAAEITCPLTHARTEVVSPLPGPWWQTPQVGNLQNTRVTTIGGDVTLVCEYRAYGATVSVMRLPPDRTPNCTANADGFTCSRRAGPPRRDAAGTYRSGLLNVPQTWHADLDGGSIDSGTFDLWFHAVTARERYLEPQNGARFGIHSGGAAISRQICRDTPKSSSRIHVRDLPSGTRVCYRTDAGRIGFFRIDGAIGRSPGTMDLDFTTWR